MRGLIPPRGREHLVFDRRSRRWVNPQQNPAKPNHSRGRLLRDRFHPSEASPGPAESRVLIRPDDGRVPSDPPGVPSCSGDLVPHEGALIPLPSWSEGGEYLMFHSQSPALARAVHRRIGGSTIVGLFAHDDAHLPERYLVRVGSVHIDAQGIADEETTLRSHPRGVLADMSESEMMDLLRENPRQDAQNWGLARQKVGSIPGLVVARN